MSKKEELFVLVKSLTRSEQRYFKLNQTHSNKDANYVKLFDAIAEQREYDEQAIKGQFRGEKFINQLHVTKHYLRAAILSSLRDFHQSISKDAELKDILRNVELLFNKELYTICTTELEKAATIADKYEILTGQIEVLTWRRRLKQAMEPNNYADFYNYVTEQSGLIELLQNNNQHWQTMILETWKTFAKSTYPKVKTFKLIPAISLEAKVLEYNTAYIKNIRSGKSKEGEEELTKLITLLEQHPQRLKEEPAPYISSINNLISYFVFSRRDDKALELINKAKVTYQQFKITTEKKSLLKQILRTYNLELEIYRDKKRKTPPDFKFIETTEQFVEINKNKIPKDYLLSLWFQLSYIHFTNGRHDDALKWLNEILNYKFGATRLDLQKYARMLNIIVHFEMENYFVLRYFVDSAKRFIKKHSELRSYEEVLLKFFIKATNTPKYEHKALFKHLKNELFPVGKDALVPESILDYVDYRYWLKKNIH